MEPFAAARTWCLLICLALFVPWTVAIKCYVCGPASRDALQHEATENLDLPSCDAFDSAENKTAFEKECAGTFHGCITQIEGSLVSRSCELLKINSCGVLTDASYCLCDTDLCNSGPISQPTPSPSQLQNHEHYGDDEDYLEREGEGEGSGSEQEYIDVSLEKTGSEVASTEAANSSNASAENTANSSDTSDIDFKGGIQLENSISGAADPACTFGLWALLVSFVISRDLL